LDGTHATRAGDLPYVGVVAHSYGTTMAANALTHTTYPVDSFTMLGSAGIDTDTVHSLTDLHVKNSGGAPAIYHDPPRTKRTCSVRLDRPGPVSPNPDVASPPAGLVPAEGPVRAAGRLEARNPHPPRGGLRSACVEVPPRIVPNPQQTNLSGSLWRGKNGNRRRHRALI
jgi:hypothetical protein